MHHHRSRAHRNARSTRRQIQTSDGGQGMKLALRWHVLLMGFLLGTSGAFAADKPTSTAQATQLAQRPGHAGIASANALATEAGFEVLAKGGNALDAAI